MTVTGTTWKHKLMSARSLLYVVIVSEHNLAELRACVHFQPQSIWLITSDRMIKSAQRLNRILEKKLPNSRLEILGHSPEQPLKGEFMAEVGVWVMQYLQPRLQQQNHSDCILNMTGGTKALSFVLTQAYPWQELHYQPFQDSEAYLERLQLLSPQSPQSLARVDLSAAAISPVENALLYVQDAKPHSRNPISDHPDSLALALLLLEAQQANRHSLSVANFWGKITPLLNQIWQVKYPKEQPYVACELPAQLREHPNFIQFIARINQLHAKKPAIVLTETGMKIATKQNHSLEHWRKWVEGGWFEQLVAHWLAEAGIESQNMVVNVQLIPEDNEQGQETDILLQHRNSLYVLELKADLPETKTVAEFENQITSLSSALGKVKKVLVLAPAVKNRLTDEQWTFFEARCQSKQVKLCCPFSVDDIKQLLR